jgi:phytoene dehydrogenase-like protein
LLEKREYDAVVVGSGPNGLAAAITLQQAGLSVILFEAKETLGGGMRTAELTLPGFKHDICSAIHPLGADSPFFKTLPLEQHGLQYIYPPAAAAHPFDDGQAAMLYTSVEDTARTLGEDANAYAKLAKPLVKIWPSLASTLLGPLRIPSNPLLMAQFGMYGILPSTLLAKWQFKNKLAKGLFAGMAAHSILPLTYTATSALGLVLMLMGHIKGWPLPKGGSQHIAQALASYFTSIGGKVVTNFPVRSLDQLPSAHTVLFDITPRQLLQIAGHTFSSYYTRQLKRYKYGMGFLRWILLWMGLYLSKRQHACRPERFTWAIHSRKLLPESKQYSKENILKNRMYCLPSKVCLTLPGLLPANIPCGLLPCTQWFHKGYDNYHRKSD